MKKSLVLLLAAAFFLGYAGAVSTGGGGASGSSGSAGSSYVKQFDESQLQCTDKPTLEGRVNCRYELAENYGKLIFLPEECVPRRDAAPDKGRLLYERARPCWKLKNETGRDACLKQKIGIGGVVSEKAKCKTIGCLYDLRALVYSLVKLRFYGLEEKAEELEELGASKGLIVSFVTTLEQRKSEFNEAKTIDAKKAVVNAVKRDWVAFKKTALGQMLEKRGNGE